MLLVRPAIDPEESLQGYCLRLAQENGLVGIKELQGLELPGVDHVQALCPRGPIAQFGSLNTSDSWGVGVRHWNTRFGRWCPRCLSEKPVWRSTWQAKLYTACHVHGLDLADRCTACNQRLSWRRQSVCYCVCGADLRDCYVGEATESQLAAAGAIASRWSCPAATDSATKGAELQLLLSRLLLLGAYRLSIKARAQKIASLDSLEIARALIDAVHDAGSDWPAGFHRLLFDLSATGRGDRTKLGTRYGAFYRALYAPWRGNSVDDLREAFSEHVANTWTGQLAHRNRRLSVKTVEDHEWVPVSVAARALHWRAPRLRLAIERGLVQGQLQKRLSGRTAGVVHRASLAELQRDMLSWVDMCTACKELKVGKKRIHALMDSGALRAVDGPTVTGVASWSFRRGDVLQALEKQAAAASCADRKCPVESPRQQRHTAKVGLCKTVASDAQIPSRAR